ncbi:hypothetical protein Pan110_39180 [Gimesia panareensis]|nr:hypothetical protein Pan110_39180 [Gimesia panareensis]
MQILLCKSAGISKTLHKKARSANCITGLGFAGIHKVFWLLFLLTNACLEGDDATRMTFHGFIHFEGQDQAAFLVVFHHEPAFAV